MRTACLGKVLQVLYDCCISGVGASWVRHGLCVRVEPVSLNCRLPFKTQDVQLLALRMLPQVKRASKITNEARRCEPEVACDLLKLQVYGCLRLLNAMLADTGS